MPQSQNTGAAANQYGHETARRIASALGAMMLGNQSNVAVFQSQRVVIKCARVRTTSVGVTYSMQSEITQVLGAFEQPDGRYKVYSLPVEFYRAKQVQSRSKPNSNHQVGKVSRTDFQNSGTLIAHLSLKEGAV